MAGSNGVRAGGENDALRSAQHLAWAHPSLWRRPPQLVFHASLGLPTLTLLVAVSVPGISLRLATPAVFALVVLGVVWIVRSIIYASAVRRAGGSGSARWFLVAPVGALVVLVLVLTSVPLRLRWALSEGDFEREVATLMAAPPIGEPIDGSVLVARDLGRLGLYDVDAVRRARDALVFELYNGYGEGEDMQLLNPGGFAYLPDGPFQGLFGLSPRTPRFVHLSGPWYAYEETH